MAKSKSNDKPLKVKNKNNGSSIAKTDATSKAPIINTLLAVTCIGVAIWFSYKGYLETRVNTPYNVEKLVTKSGLEVPDRYWGTYRPGVYFGLKTRDPHSLVTGLMWYFPYHLRNDGSGLRHWCDQEDKLDRYAWLEHDGRTFGVQEIVDNSVVLKTTFVKRLGGNHGGDWTSYWKSSLYTAVPSRSFFPRGFLWDEGFHGLLISAWDLEIELDIINHWFDLMNVEGWIPREMILGQEALAKVPEEFVTQVNTNANPPTFFLTLHFILQHSRQVLLEKHFNFLESLYPQLQAWFNWFNSTQVGELSGTYRWRGRDATTTRELNPKTLTSGLDDYPRASHPDSNEYHVDLRCWIAFAANIMSQISDILNHSNYKYEETYKYLTNNELLNKLHWSPNTQTYSDYGLHTDKVVLRRPTSPPRSHTPPLELIRVVLEDPTLRFVDSTFGYVSLFPFLLQMIDPHSPQMEKVLDDLMDPDLLWTQYGLRSLSKKSPLYMKYNTEHDPPYWRGPIWMNLNYLTVRALFYYSSIQGPYQLKAKKVYHELRQNLIKNVIKQYQKTGYIWENYEDNYGSGKRSHPFTGWTSLVLLLMAEMY